MEITFNFVHAGEASKILIKGSPANPCFRAIDVANAVQICNVRTSISAFTEDECILDADGSNFLTERGLLKLLYRSRKPISMEFLNWAMGTMKGIRETDANEKDELLEKTQRLEAELGQVTTVGNKPAIYIYNTNKREAQPLLKIGITSNYVERSNPYRQTHPYGGTEFVRELPVDFTKIKSAETFLHTLLHNHQVKGREMFDMKIEAAKAQVYIVTSLMDMQYTKSEAVCERVSNRLCEVLAEELYNQKVSLVTVDASTQTTEADERPITKPDPHRFQQFIDEACILGADLEVSSKQIMGEYRIWAQKADKVVFHALQDYLMERFRPMRLSVQDADKVVQGFRGVALKGNFKMDLGLNPSEAETFLFSECTFAPDGKVSIRALHASYISWQVTMQKTNKSGDCLALTRYLDAHPRALKAVLYTEEGSAQGFYGVMLKKDVCNYYKRACSTAKAVEKWGDDNVLLMTYSTIAKAASAEKIPACNMSALLRKDKAHFEGYYYRLKPT